MSERNEKLARARQLQLGWQPHRPTATPAEAMRGVVYEDFPGIRVGNLATAISKGYALPRIYGERRVFSSSAAMCVEGVEGGAFKLNRKAGAQ